MGKFLNIECEYVSKISMPHSGFSSSKVSFVPPTPKEKEKKEWDPICLAMEPWSESRAAKKLCPSLSRAHKMGRRKEKKKKKIRCLNWIGGERHNVLQLRCRCLLGCLILHYPFSNPSGILPCRIWREEEEERIKIVMEEEESYTVSTVRCVSDKARRGGRP